MPPMDPPKQAILLPNTQSMYCQYHNFCRGGIAAYQLARGPARNLWIPLCRTCAEDMFRLAPDRLIRVCVEGAVERGLTRMVELGLGASGQPVEALPESTLANPPASGDPADLSRETVLAYLQENAEDPELLEGLAEIFGAGEPQEPQDDPVPTEQAQGAPAPAKGKETPPKAPAKAGTRKPAKKPGKR